MNDHQLNRESDGMNTQSRSIVGIVILAAFVLMGQGCGTKTLRGKMESGAWNEMDPTQASLSSSQEPLASGVVSPNPRESDEVGLTEMSPVMEGEGELLTASVNDEGMQEEESRDKKLSPSQEARQYWDERRRAELTSTKVGLQDIHFGFDSWQLTHEAKRILKENAEWLKMRRHKRVIVEGHCDERGTRAYNYVLGQKRATMARNYLVALGVSPNQVAVMTYGKDKAVCQEFNEACYHKNRRAHVVLSLEVASNQMTHE